jgi:hypothetical protein
MPAHPPKGRGIRPVKHHRSSTIATIKAALVSFASVKIGMAGRRESLELELVYGKVTSSALGPNGRSRANAYEVITIGR